MEIHGDSELQNPFHSDIQDGRHEGYLQKTSPPKPLCGVSPNLMGGIGGT